MPIDRVDRFRNRVIRGVLTALEQEIMVSRSNPERAFRVRGGQLRSRHHFGCFYSFKVEMPLPVPPESPVQLQVGDQLAHGHLVAQSDLNALTFFPRDLGERISSGLLSCDATFIYERARDFLQSASEDLGEDDMPLHLLGYAGDGASTQAACLPDGSGVGPPPNPEQESAALNCLGSRVHFVWGPPGTGKTANLAQVCHLLVRQGERVLIVAHANAAVDAAMSQVVHSTSDSSLYRRDGIVRFGTAHLQSIEDDPHINPDLIVGRKNPYLLARREELIARRDDLSWRILNSSASTAEDLHCELQEIREELEQVDDAVDEMVTDLLQNAEVVGTTLSRMAIDQRVQTYAPDVVLVDEASMAPFPLVLMAAFAARRRVGIFGDFRQLPPIHSDASRAVQEWLGRDTFQIAGKVKAAERTSGERQVTMLRTQYRMAQPICDLVSRLAYMDRLESDESVLQETAGMADSDPLPGHPLIMLDTARLHPGCMREMRHGSYSRFTMMHAAICAAITHSLAGGGCDDIAVITPYRIQGRLLHDLIEGVGLSDMVTASTVHRFQGSESDAVIFDLVDTYPQTQASNLTGRGPDALRLLNVGLSRARGKLVVVADTDFIDRVHPRRLPARRIVNLIKDNGTVVSLDESNLREVVHAPFLQFLDDWGVGQERLAADLVQAHESAHLQIPDGFLLGDGLKAAVRSAARTIGGEMTMAAPHAIASGFEEEDLSLSLLTRDSGVFALIDGATAYWTSRLPETPVIRLQLDEPVPILQEVAVAGEG